VPRASGPYLRPCGKGRTRRPTSRAPRGRPGVPTKQEARSRCIRMGLSHQYDGAIPCQGGGAQARNVRVGRRLEDMSGGATIQANRTWLGESRSTINQRSPDRTHVGQMTSPHGCRSCEARYPLLSCNVAQPTIYIRRSLAIFFSFATTHMHTPLASAPL
jgi:hypothetical protein